MKMTLEEAKYCLSPKLNGCKDCKFDKQGEFDCRGTALEIGASALNYLMLSLETPTGANKNTRR